MLSKFFLQSMSFVVFFSKAIIFSFIVKNVTFISKRLVKRAYFVQKNCCQITYHQQLLFLAHNISEKEFKPRGAMLFFHFFIVVIIDLNYQDRLHQQILCSKYFKSLIHFKECSFIIINNIVYKFISPRTYKLQHVTVCSE